MTDNGRERAEKLAAQKYPALDGPRLNSRVVSQLERRAYVEGYMGRDSEMRGYCSLNSDLQNELETLRLLHDNGYGVHDEDPWDVAYEAIGRLLAAVEAVAKVADRLHELSESPIGDPGARVSRGEASLWITAALEHKLIGDSDDNA